MRKFIILCMILSASVSVHAFAQGENDHAIRLGEEIAPKDTTSQRRFANRLIAPKGGWQCGLSVMYADFSTANSDYMMLLQGVDARASMLRLSLEGAYTFRPNHAVGARFSYTNIDGVVDAATADLLGNLSMSFSNMHAMSRSMSGSIFKRTYVGLDTYGRVGIFWDYVLGYTWNKTHFYTGDAPTAYSLNKKIHLGFSPGIIYFPMNNVSIQFSISIADLSYNDVSAYNDGVRIGGRHAWKAQASLNILDLNFGITIHL